MVPWHECKMLVPSIPEYPKGKEPQDPEVAVPEVAAPVVTATLASVCTVPYILERILDHLTLEGVWSVGATCNSLNTSVGTYLTSTNNKAHKAHRAAKKSFMQRTGGLVTVWERREMERMESAGGRVRTYRKIALRQHWAKVGHHYIYVVYIDRGRGMDSTRSNGSPHARGGMYKRGLAGRGWVHMPYLVIGEWTLFHLIHPSIFVRESTEFQDIYVSGKKLYWACAQIRQSSAFRDR